MIISRSFCHDDDDQPTFNQGTVGEYGRYADVTVLDPYTHLSFSSPSRDDGYFSDLQTTHNASFDTVPDLRELLPDLSCDSTESLRAVPGSALEKALLMQEAMTPKNGAATRNFRATLLVSREKLERAM
jgi:hypothetical protein